MKDIGKEKSCDLAESIQKYINKRRKEGFDLIPYYKRLMTADKPDKGLCEEETPEGVVVYYDVDNDYEGGPCVLLFDEEGKKILRKNDLRVYVPLFIMKPAVEVIPSNENIEEIGGMFLKGYRKRMFEYLRQMYVAIRKERGIIDLNKVMDVWKKKYEEINTILLFEKKGPNIFYLDEESSIEEGLLDDYNMCFVNVFNTWLPYRVMFEILPKRNEENGELSFIMLNMFNIVCLANEMFVVE